MDNQTALTPTTEAAPSPEMQAILAGYAEAARRDTLVEIEKWHWKLGAFLGWSVAGLLILVVVWLLLTRREVDAFVQVVQVDQAGKVVPLGVPVDLLQYDPDDGLWLDMIGQWIRAVRWRGIDPHLAQEEWRWAYLHTCGEARRVLQHLEDKDKPLTLGKCQVSVVLTSITKTPAPKSYHALWEEWVTENNQPPVTQRWAGTFTTGRLRPKDQAAALQNRLGLCIAAFDLSVQPDK